MTEHAHNEEFCLTCLVTEVAPLLPRQNPIKDFIHQNMLQVFIDEPFDEAVVHAAKLFKARTYMELAYYRDKFREGAISDECLDYAIQQNFGDRNESDRRVIKHALTNFTEIFDEKTFNCLMDRRPELKERLGKASETVRRLHLQEDIRPVSLRELLNDHVDSQIDHSVNAILFRLIGSFIDQGVSLWNYLDSHNDFLSAIRHLAMHSKAPIAPFVDIQDFVQSIMNPPGIAVAQLVKKMFSSERLCETYIRESLLHHPGWSGMINIISQNPDSLPRPRTIDLESLLAVKIALEWQFIKDRKRNFKPVTPEDVFHATENKRASTKTRYLTLTYYLCTFPQDLGQPCDDVLKSIEQTRLQKTWHEAFELTYYGSVAKTFSLNNDRFLQELNHPQKFQAIFCIDDREFSFSYHLENESPDVKTFGFPGFFSIDCFFRPHKNELLEKLCPITIAPKHVVIERGQDEKGPLGQNKIVEIASFITRHGANSIWFGFVSAYTLGHLSLFRLLLSFFQPLKMMKTKELLIKEERTSVIFERKDDNALYKNLLIGYTEQEMATRIFNTLRSTGLNKDFAKAVFIIGHGSSSVNNPHFATYDCGACSSRPGSINARVFAAMANLQPVRKLVADLGIKIPDETIFVGGYHDTCTDHVEFFDLDKLSEKQALLVKEFSTHVYSACEKNAYERCKWFALVSPNITPKTALRETRHRSRALFEPRHELGHTNVSLCIISRKERVYKKDFKRRAFFQSYNPSLDPDGKILVSILSAAIPVCGGINFDYYFSRLDPAVYGCGTKLSHNVCSLVGVGNGLDDDLRTGLPIQMTELHEPIRLLVVIEQNPEIILQAINANPDLPPWVQNDWVKLARLDLNSDRLSMYNPKTRTFSDEGIF